MAPEERRDQDQDEPLRVTDRRRFTETGEARGGASTEEASRPDPPPAEPGPAGTERSEARESAPPASGPPPGELGIGAVFLAFWQGALMNLGAADPGGNRLPVNLEAARESIELLRVLQQKTAGNLSEEEEGMLRHLLHEAQLAYVQVAGGSSEGGSES